MINLSADLKLINSFPDLIVINMIRLDISKVKYRIRETISLAQRKLIKTC